LIFIQGNEGIKQLYKIFNLDKIQIFGYYSDCNPGNSLGIGKYYELDKKVIRERNGLK